MIIKEGDESDTNQKLWWIWHSHKTESVWLHHETTQVDSIEKSLTLKTGILNWDHSDTSFGKFRVSLKPSQDRGQFDITTNWHSGTKTSDATPNTSQKMNQMGEKEYYKVPGCK